MKLIVTLLVLVAAVLPAQVVYIENNGLTTGTINTFPWGQANGFTTLHVYYASQLAAAGVCAGALLTDAAVVPASGTSGVYNAPQARLSIGHLVTPTPVAGAWESNLLAPTVVHDLTSGPYTFPWTLATWTSLPGVPAAGFVWDGITNIAIFYTSSAGTTGTFNIRRTATNLRHAVTVFNATNQAPTSNGLFAMKVRLTFAAGSATYQVNQPGASFDVDGVQGWPCLPATVTRGVGVGVMIGFQSTNVGFGWELALTAPEVLVPAGGGALILPLSGQILNIDVTAPSLTLLNAFTFPPFPGNFALGFTSASPLGISAQMLVIDPTNPDSFALSGATRLIFQ